MVLIRIADFLQIQSARAPIFFTEIHKIKSPFSANEWRVHRSISNITRTSFDPEAIQINASPPDIQAFLRLDQWFRELQTELDTSWAVLGEIYGRFENVGLPNLKIDIRRIRSNLEGHKSLSQNLPYVPMAVRNTNFPGSNKREVIDHIRLGKDHWPAPPFMYHASQNYLTTRANWVGHHAILLSLAKTALRARNLPRYVEKTIQNGHVVKTSNGDYLIFATGDTPVGEFSHLVVRLFRLLPASRRGEPASRAAARCHSGIL
jgi:hypothetical protein